MKSLPGLAISTWLLLSGRAVAAGTDCVELRSPAEITGTNNPVPGQVAHSHVGPDGLGSVRAAACPPTESTPGSTRGLRCGCTRPKRADLLDIFYESPDKRWCSAASCRLPRAGPPTAWTSTRIAGVKRPPAPSRQWGGPSRRVSSLHPGNQAERWVALDYVRLESPGPGLEEGVTVEPLGTARPTARAYPPPPRPAP